MAKAKKKAPVKKATSKTTAKKAAPKAAAKVKATAKKAAKTKVAATKTAPKAKARATAKKAAPKKAATQKATPKATAKTAGKAAPSKSNSKSAKVQKAPATASSTKAKAVDWSNFLTPLDDRLIIEISSGERMTAGGLHIPDTAADQSGNFKGTVLIAGRGHRDEKGRVQPMDVHAGDTVLFAEFSGSKLNLQGRDVLLLRETDILGIVDKK